MLEACQKIPDINLLLKQMPNSLVKNPALLLEILPSAKYRQTADFTDRLIPKISNAPA